MPVSTINAYGKISISNEAIASVTDHIALDCYGVVDLVNQNFFDSVTGALKKNKVKGIKVVTVGNRIFIDMCVVLKYGVSISTVTNNLKSAIKYGVEKFTGMIVNSININVVGIRV